MCQVPGAIQIIGKEALSKLSKPLFPGSFQSHGREKQPNNWMHENTTYQLAVNAMKENRARRGTEREGSGYSYSWVDWESLSALWEITLNGAWGDEPWGHWKSNSKGHGRSRSVVSVRRKGWLDSDGQGCRRMRSVWRLLWGHWGTLDFIPSDWGQEPEDILSAGTTLPTCVFFRLPFWLLCMGGLCQRRRKEDCSHISDGQWPPGTGDQQSEMVGFGVFRYDKT